MLLPTFAFAFLLLSSGITYLEYKRISAARRASMETPRLAVSGALPATEVGATGNPSPAP